MGRRFDTLLFPGGKSKACTFSYDDGVVQDRRLAQLFRDHGLKCSFNISGTLFSQEGKRDFPGRTNVDVSKIAREEVPVVYEGHELCGHGLYHSLLDSVGNPLAMYEIIEDKRLLEQLAGSPLRMFAYPYGTYNRDVQEILRLAGYQGARTTHSTHSFDIPADFLQWDPTCHHNDPALMELARQFLSGNPRGPMLFYIWGHSYEFDGFDQWDVIEELAEFLDRNREPIWFAANGEIMEYVTAYRRLEYSADGSLIRNPSAVDIWIRTADFSTAILKAGTVTHIENTP